MPKGPKGEKRSAGVMGNAVKVMRIATGEEQEDIAPESAAATLGKCGGKARAKAPTRPMMYQQRSADARQR